jgi:hypothetical protein
MNKNLKLFGFIAFIVVIGFSMIACGGDNKLSGTWDSAPQNEYNATISFSGKNFTITEYPSYSKDEYNSYWGWMSDSFSGRGKDFNRNNLILVNTIMYRAESKTDVYRNVMDGTYSISDDKIELSYSDGEIKVLSFSRTENTITIGGNKLIRKN